MIQPIHDRIVLKKVNLEAKSKGGLFLGEIESERDVSYGKVLAVGKGKQVESGVIPITLKEGDIIVFNGGMARRINYKGEEVFLIREADTYAIIDDPDVTLTDFVTEKYDTRPQPKMLG